MKKYECETFVVWQDMWNMEPEVIEDMKEGALETLIMSRMTPDAWEWVDDPDDPSRAGGYFRGTYSEGRILEMARELNDEDLDDERRNLDRPLPATLWAWDDEWGMALRLSDLTTDALRIDNSSCNLNQCLDLFDSYAEITKIVVEGEELINREVYHDRHDKYIVRMEKPDMTDEERDDFKYLLEWGKANDAMERYTIPMGDMVREVYGVW